VGVRAPAAARFRVGMGIVLVRMGCGRERFAGRPHVVIMKRQEPLQKEHGQKTRQGPEHAVGQRRQLVRRMRQKVQERHPQHQPRHQAHRHLEPGMTQPQGEQRPAAGQRRKRDQHAVNEQQSCRRQHSITHNSMARAGFQKSYLTTPTPPA